MSALVVEAAPEAPACGWRELDLLRPVRAGAVTLFDVEDEPLARALARAYLAGARGAGLLARLGPAGAAVDADLVASLRRLARRRRAPALVATWAPPSSPAHHLRERLREAADETVLVRRRADGLLLRLPGRGAAFLCAAPAALTDARATRAPPGAAPSGTS